MNQTMQRPTLSPVPTPALTEIEMEMSRLHDAVDRVDSRFNDLAARLHTVRVDGSEKASTAEPKDPSPLTKLGAQIRTLSDHLDAVSENIGYQTRNVQLPA